MGNSDQRKPLSEMTEIMARLAKIDIELEEITGRLNGLEVREVKQHPPTTQELVQDYGRTQGPEAHDHPNPFAPEGHPSDDEIAGSGR